MKRIVVSTYVTLDGVVEAPHTWPFRAQRDQEEARLVRETLFAAEALVLGRKTYEAFAAAWAARTAADDEPGTEGFIDRINQMPKYVASTTLAAPLAWNATLLGGDLAAAVAQLKAQPGQDLLMYGCGPVANQLMRAGLVDELQLWVYPLVRGAGARFFTDAETFPPLNLQRAQPLASGIVVLTYQPGLVA